MICFNFKKLIRIAEELIMHIELKGKLWSFGFSELLSCFFFYYKKLHVYIY
jgi:hypothetical protein